MYFCISSDECSLVYISMYTHTYTCIIQVGVHLYTNINQPLCSWGKCDRYQHVWGDSREGKLTVYPRILQPHLAPKTKVPCNEEAMKFPRRPGLEVNKLRGLDPAPKEPLLTQRDGMRREVGGGFRMRNTRTPMADSCQCMAKPLQYCKVISFQLKKKRKEPFPLPGGNLAFQ